MANFASGSDHDVAELDYVGNIYAKFELLAVYGDNRSNLDTAAVAAQLCTHPPKWGKAL